MHPESQSFHPGPRCAQDASGAAPSKERRQARSSPQWFTAGAWPNVARARHSGSDIDALLHFHSNRFVSCMVLNQRSQSLWGRVCIGRGHADRRRRRHISVFEPSPSELGKIDSWARVQQEPCRNILAAQPSKFDFWYLFQSKPCPSDFAEQLAKFDFMFLSRSEPWSSDLAEQLAQIDFRF